MEIVNQRREVLRGLISTAVGATVAGENLMLSPRQQNVILPARAQPRLSGSLVAVRLRLR